MVFTKQPIVCSLEKLQKENKEAPLRKKKITHGYNQGHMRPLVGLSTNHWQVFQ